jgi:iron complex outermembrane recepter protein
MEVRLHVRLAALVLAFALSASGGAAQTTGSIQGSVRSSGDGQPVEGLNIQLEGTGLGVFSAADGSFRIQGVPAGRRTLLVSGLGVATTRRDISVEGGESVTRITVLVDLAVNALDGITVEASRSPSRTVGIPAPLREIPLSVGTVDADRLQMQGVDNMLTALGNVTGVRPIETYGGFHHYNIRGFQDFVLLVDGVRDERHNISESAPMSNLSTVDRVEVLKGPASVLYGHSALGGVINILRKQPSFTPAYELSAGVGSFGTRRTAVGATGPVTESLQYRFDAGLSEEEGWRGSGSTRSTAHLALRWTPSPRDEVGVQLGAMKDDYRLDAGLPTVNGVVPAGVARDTRYNSGQDFMDYERLDLQANWTRTFSPSLSLRAQASHAWDDYLYLSTEYLEVRPGNRVYREWFQFDTRVRPLQGVVELTHQAERDGLRFRTMGGYAFNRIDRTRPRDRSLGEATEVDLFRPRDDQPAVTVEEDILFVTEETIHGLYLQEFVEFDDRFRLLAGARLDLVDGLYRTDMLVTAGTPSTGTPTERTHSPVTFRLGAVWLPAPSLSVFSGYSTFFKQPRQIPVDGTPLDPETGWQAEAGVRYDPTDRFSLTLAAYQIRKEDAIVGLGQGRFSQAGEAESQGFEVDARWDSGAGFQVSGGYSYTDAVYTSFGNFTGNRIQYAPDHQAHLWGDYNLRSGPLRGLTLSLGGNLVGDNWAGPDNAVLLPAYTVLNGALSYRLGAATLGVNVNNLLDGEFFTTAINGFQLYPGAPRNVLVRVNWEL